MELEQEYGGSTRDVPLEKSWFACMIADQHACQCCMCVSATHGGGGLHELLCCAFGAADRGSGVSQAALLVPAPVELWVAPAQWCARRAALVQDQMCSECETAPLQVQLLQPAGWQSEVRAQRGAELQVCGCTLFCTRVCMFSCGHRVDETASCCCAGHANLGCLPMDPGCARFCVVSAGASTLVVMHICADEVRRFRQADARTAHLLQWCCRHCGKHQGRCCRAMYVGCRALMCFAVGVLWVQREGLHHGAGFWCVATAHLMLRCAACSATTFHVVLSSSSCYQSMPCRALLRRRVTRVCRQQAATARTAGRFTFATRSVPPSAGAGTRRCASRCQKHAR
jgi:hypothetical protein